MTRERSEPSRLARRAVTAAVRGYFDPVDTARPVRPRFLSVAYETGRLSLEQCWQVYEAQQRYRTRASLPPSIGNLCVDLNLLTPQAVEEVLHETSIYLYEARCLPDPLARPAGPRRLGSAVRVSAAAGAVVILALTLTGIITEWNLSALAVAASVASGVVCALASIMPTALRGYLKWGDMLRILFGSLLPLSFGYGVYVAHSLYEFTLNASHVSAPDLQTMHVADALWKRLILSASVFALCTLWLYVSRAWRKYESRILEVRLDVFGALVSAAHRVISGEAGRKGQSDSGEIEDVLQPLAQMLRSNPFDYLLKKLFFWQKTVGAVTIWYLERSRDRSDGLVIKNFAAPGAPHEVWQALDKIKANYRPAMLDEEQYRHAMRTMMREDGRLDRKRFASIADKPDYVSLAGFVFARKVAVTTGDAGSCLAYDSSHLDALDLEQRSRTVRGWLEFRSIAAYPVYASLDQGGTPDGVLAAFKNINNGFTAGDYSALSAAARLIGLCLQQVECVSERHENRGR